MINSKVWHSEYGYQVLQIQKSEASSQSKPRVQKVLKCLPEIITLSVKFNTLRLIQNGRHFTDNLFKRIFLNGTVRISIKISLKFVPKGPISNIPALVQIMAWRWPGNKPLSEPMIVTLPTYICVTVKAETKWTTFCRWHFQMYFLQWKSLNSF